MVAIGPSSLRFFGAILCIAVAVISWVIMAEKLQGLFNEYPQSYFMVYWVHSWYAFLYIVWKGWREFPGNCQCNHAKDGALDWKRALWTSTFISVIALVSAYFWYLSLPRTSVPANTAIYQSSIAFIFVLSVPILREKVTVVKVVAVVFSICGITLVAVYSERDKNSKVQQSALGYVYLVISTILYALMEVLFKKLATFKQDPAAACNGLRFVGLMGIHTLVWMWPPIIILHFIGVEHFTWPTSDILILIVLNTVLDVLFNGAIFLCIALSSPLFTSIGTVTATPVSIIVDFLIHRKSALFLVYIGMGLIAVGFIGFSVSEFIQLRNEVKEETDQEAIDSSLDTNSHKDDKYSVNAATSSGETDSLVSNTFHRKNRWKHIVLKYVL